MSTTGFVGTTFFWYHTEKDTVINGENYKKIIQTDNPLVSCFLREDTIQKKVYMYRGNNTDGLVYDFSISIGQSYISYNDDTLVLIEIDTQNTLDGPRNRYTFRNFDAQLNIHVVEGVGSKEDPILLSTWGGCPSNLLVCSYENKVQVYYSADICAADTFETRTNYIVSNNISINEIYYPDYVLIQLNGLENVSNNKTLYLFDNIGRIIYQKIDFNNSFKIEVDNLANGLYFYQIEINKTFYSGKIFLK